MAFTDGNDSCCTGISVNDQNGVPAVNSSIVQQWNSPIADLTPAAGKTISQLPVPFSRYPRARDAYYQDLLYQGADRTRMPLYNPNPTITVSPICNSASSQAS